MDNSLSSSCFQDSVGRTWTIAISAGTCRRIAAKMQVNLLSPDLDVERIFGLVSQPHMLIDALWIACQGQHDGVDESQFCDALGGEELSGAIAILKSSIVCWCEQLCPSSGIGLRLEKASKFEVARRQKLQQLLDSPEVDEMAEKHLQNAYSQGIDAMRDMLESQ